MSVTNLEIELNKFQRTRYRLPTKTTEVYIEFFYNRVDDFFYIEVNNGRETLVENMRFVPDVDYLKKIINERYRRFKEVCFLTAFFVGNGSKPEIKSSNIKEFKLVFVGGEYV